MNRLLSPVIAATLAASFAAATPMPAGAAPVYVPNAAPARTDVQPVHSRDDWRWQRRDWRRHGWRERCWRWGDCPSYGGRYYGDRDHYYGYRDRYYGFSPRYHHRRHYYGDSYRRGGVTLQFGF